MCVVYSALDRDIINSSINSRFLFCRSMTVCLYVPEHQIRPVRHHHMLDTLKTLRVSGVHNISSVNICMAVDEYYYY